MDTINLFALVAQLSSIASVRISIGLTDNYTCFIDVLPAFSRRLLFSRYTLEMRVFFLDESDIQNMDVGPDTDHVMFWSTLSTLEN